jgi:hypothetical protein
VIATGTAIAIGFHALLKKLIIIHLTKRTRKKMIDRLLAILMKNQRSCDEDKDQLEEQEEETGEWKF